MENSSNLICKSKSWIRDTVLLNLSLPTFRSINNSSSATAAPDILLKKKHQLSKSCFKRSGLYTIHCNINPKRYKVQSKRNVGTKRSNEQMKQPVSFLKWSANNFRFGKLLGTGKFSKVYLAQELVNNTNVAIKVLSKDEMIEDRLEHQVLREISIQTRLRHPNIIQMFTYFSDHKYIYLVLEYASGGELYKHLRNSPMKRFSNSIAAKYIYQVADALQYCHENKVIHRDVKPENLILSEDGNIKLSDFGWSVYSPRSKRRTLCGTVDYIPPEMIKKDYYDERVDHWCLGVLCFELLVGQPPFRSKDNNETFRKIIALEFEYPSFMCFRAKDLISKLLQSNPKARLSLSKVKQHDWIISMKQKNERCQSNILF